jgi:5-methylcytosine-specific restriction enzyme subunit McrC
VREIVQAFEQDTIPLGHDEIVRSGHLDVYPEILKKDLLRVSLRGAAVELLASGAIGLIPLNDRLAVNVSPKVPVSSVERLLSVTGSRPNMIANIERRYDTIPEASAPFVHAIAAAFLERLDRIIGEGLQDVYTEQHAATSFPKGRLRILETLRGPWARERPYKVVASWFSPTVDTEANRLLKCALWALGRIHQTATPSPIGRPAASLANRLFAAMSEVESVSDDEAVRADMLSHEESDLGADYGSACQLARVILAHRGLQVSPGDAMEVALPLLVVRLDELFEEYVRRVLRRRSPEATLVVYDGNMAAPRGARKKLLDGDGVETDRSATPDCVIVDSRLQSPKAIVEVKYKRYETGAPERGDVNQVLAYALSYRCAIAIIVHPCAKGQNSGIAFMGTAGGVAKLYTYAYDLDATALEDAEAAFSRAVFEIAGHARNTSN